MASRDTLRELAWRVLGREALVSTPRHASGGHKGYELDLYVGTKFWACARGVNADACYADAARLIIASKDGTPVTDCRCPCWSCAHGCHSSCEMQLGTCKDEAGNKRRKAWALAEAAVTPEDYAEANRAMHEACPEMWAPVDAHQTPGAP